MVDENVNIVSYWHEQVAKYGERPSYRVKINGAWVSRSWREYGDTVKKFALGLLSSGVQPGERVAILSSTREEWDIADRASLAIGAVGVGIYHSNPPEQVRYILDHSEAKVAVVENGEQWAKIEKVRSRLSGVEKFVLIDPLADMSEPQTISFTDFLELGMKHKEEFEEEYRNRGKNVKLSDAAICVYTSGTTGPPKGAVLNHGSIMAVLEAFRLMKIFIPEEDRTVSWLPLPHVFGRFVIFCGIHNASIWSYAGSVETLIQDLAEINPTVFHSVPRIYEKIYHKMISEVEKASPFKRWIFGFCVEVGREVSQLKQQQKAVPAFLKIKHAIAEKLLFKKLRGILGGRIRAAITGGAPLSREILEFFHAAGILIMEGYGLTESPMATFNRPESYKFGTIGPAVAGMEIKIAEDGEILLRSPIVFEGYLKDPEKTKEAFSEDGWFYTGDIGVMSPDGYITITDRKKDIIITAGGKNIAPQNIENMLKTSLFISQAMVYGDRKPYLTALIILDREELQIWADAQGIKAKSHEELCRDQRVNDLVADVVDEKSKDLAGFETIKKFTILPQEFTEEAGEVTATMKVKRRFVSEKYKDVLEKMY